MKIVKKQKTLIDSVKKLKEIPEIKLKVDRRMHELYKTRDSHPEVWFSELCFCLLTANAKARTAIAIQQELGFDGFSKLKEPELVQSIRNNKHRFHNVKAKNIIRAREHIDIRDKLIPILGDGDLNSQRLTRDWLKENIHGYGYKESSHFLRNIGYFDLAILDRHVFALLEDFDYINKRPKNINKDVYEKHEDIVLDISEQVDMIPAELDFYLWYMKGGDILK